MADNPVLINMLTTQMRYMTQRQAVLSQNVANIDTPGYKSKDLKKLDFANMAAMESKKLAMVATSPKHLEAPGGGGLQAFEIKYIQGSSTESSPNGNTVTLEDELAKVDDTTGKFEESSLLLKKYTQMMHEAAGSH